MITEGKRQEIPLPVASVNQVSLSHFTNIHCRLILSQFCRQQGHRHQLYLPPSSHCRLLHQGLEHILTTSPFHPSSNSPCISARGNRGPGGSPCHWFCHQPASRAGLTSVGAFLLYAAVRKILAKHQGASALYRWRDGDT